MEETRRQHGLEAPSTPSDLIYLIRTGLVGFMGNGDLWIGPGY